MKTAVSPHAQHPTIHFDPVFDRLGLTADPAIAAATLSNLGFQPNDIRHIHLADDPESYKSLVSDDITGDLGHHVVVGLGAQLANANVSSAARLKVVERAANLKIVRSLAALPVKPNAQPQPEGEREDLESWLSTVVKPSLKVTATSAILAYIFRTSPEFASANGAVIALYTAIESNRFFEAHRNNLPQRPLLSLMRETVAPPGILRVER